MRSLEDVEELIQLLLVLLVIGAFLYYKGDISKAFDGVTGWFKGLGTKTEQFFAGTQLPSEGSQPGADFSGFQADDSGDVIPSSGAVVAGGFGGGSGGAF